MPKEPAEAATPDTLTSQQAYLNAPGRISLLPCVNSRPHLCHRGDGISRPSCTEFAIRRVIYADRIPVSPQGNRVSPTDYRAPIQRNNGDLGISTALPVHRAGQSASISSQLKHRKEVRETEY